MDVQSRSLRSRVRVAVEPTNEEWVAAFHSLGVLREGVSPIGGRTPLFTEARP